MWLSALLTRLAEIVGRGESPRRRRPILPVRLIRRGPDALPRPGRGSMKVVYESAVVHETSSLKSRIVNRGVRLVLKPLLHFAPLNERTLAAMRSADRLSSRRSHSRYTEPVRFELGGVPVESLTHRFGPDSDLTILYLHGGGFFSGGIDSHRRVCERLALRSGATVISVDYVQLPDGTVADSVQDAINAYTGLVKTTAHPDKIVVAGDSAGGYLAMKIAELAARRRLPLPAGVIGFSPLLSLDPDSVDKGIQQAVRARDAYLPLGKINRIRPMWMPDGSDEIEGEDSPLDAAKWISSPTFMVAVEDEILRPEVEAMALALTERGVEVETHLWRHQVHAFPVLASALPESELAVRLAAAFARRVVGEPEVDDTRDADAHTEVMSGEVA